MEGAPDTKSPISEGAETGINKKYLFSFLAIVLVLFIIVVTSGKVKLSLFFSRAAGIDSDLLYGQDFGVSESANLSDPGTQRSVLSDVRSKYDKSWDMAQLEISPAGSVVREPLRGDLMFDQVLETPDTHNKIYVEDAFVRLIIGALGAVDDSLEYNYIDGLDAREPKLTMEQARSSLLLPIDAEADEGTLVYHHLFSDLFRAPEEPPFIPEPSATSSQGAMRISHSALAEVGEATGESIEDAPTDSKDSATELPQESLEQGSDNPPSPLQTDQTQESVPPSLGSPSESPTPSPLPGPSEEPPAIKLSEKYALAYRFSIGSAIKPDIPKTGGGSRGRSSRKSIDTSGQAGVDEYCDIDMGNKSCQTGLVCNSISSSCRLPLPMSSCKIDSDCNADGKSDKSCGTDYKCHVSKTSSGSSGLIFGTGNGLLGSYFCINSSTGVATHKFDQVDQMINFNWGAGSPVDSYCPINNKDYFSEDWSGKVEAPSSGAYTFYLKIDDSGILKMDSYRVEPRTSGEYSFTRNLVGGQFYNIKASHSESTGNALAILSWSGPGIAKQVIPKKYLYTYDALPPVVTNEPKDVVVTEGLSASLTAVFEGTYPMDFVWHSKKGSTDVVIAGAKTATYKIAKTSLSDTGCYYVVATNSFGTNTSACAKIDVTPLPPSPEHGLRAYYYGDTSLLPSSTGSDDGSSYPIVTLNPNIDYYWSANKTPICPDSLPCSLPKSGDKFGIRWYGEVYIPTAGDYAFGLDTQGGARLWIDDKLIVDNWLIPDLGYVGSTIHFDSATKHKIRVDYWKKGGDAHAKLYWYGPGIPFEIVPSEFLSPLDFHPEKPNVELGDYVWVNADSGQIIEKVNTNRD